MDGQKCGHEQCTCYVDLGQLYCGEQCRTDATAGLDDGPHAACGCRHAECVNS